MDQPDKKPRHVRTNQRALTVLQVALALLTGLLAWSAVSNGIGQMWKLMTALSAVSAVGAVLRFGWVIPGVVCGTLGGVFLDATIKGGTVESQMWETVAYIGVGAVLGLLVGIVVDAFE